MFQRVRAWLHSRLAADPAAAERGLPKGVGWGNTLGGVILALLAVQAVTGILLAMYYSPHPDAAYESVHFITFTLPMGRLVRGIHHYADSALMVVLLLHVIRTYLHAAYKPPRELVWLSGIALLLLVVGFGFTGYLLPWDQNAYWATQVRTSYAGQVPVIGPVLLQLLRGGPDIGALTITRFYAIHTLLLPALVLALVHAHVLLARRKGPTPVGAPVGHEEAPRVPALPERQLFRTAVAILVVFGIVYALAWLRPVELEFKANPSDATYDPRAEWYFLFLFQFVKNFGQIPGIGKLTWLPVVVIPGVAIGFLALAPWIDRSPERKARRRPAMVAALVVALLGMTGLTLQAMLTLHPNATPSNSLYGRFTDRGEQPLDPKLVARGREAFASAKPVPCSACHKAYSDYSQAGGPDLSGYGMKSFLKDVPGHPEMASLSFYDRFVRYVRGHVRPLGPDGQPQTRMPNYPEEQLTPEELDAIGAYLSQDPKKPIITHANPRNP